MTAKKSSNLVFVYGLHTVSAVLENQPQRAKKLFIARRNECGFRGSL